MTKSLNLNEIESGVAVAGVGPWRASYLGPCISIVDDGDASEIAVLQPTRSGSAEFIARARQDVPALVARVRALEELLVQLRLHLEMGDLVAKEAALDAIGAAIGEKQ